jgi:hypothetical protein
VQISWDALNDWSGCPLGGNEMKIEKSRGRNCFRKNLISGMRLRVMCANGYR